MKEYSDDQVIGIIQTNSSVELHYVFEYLYKSMFPMVQRHINNNGGSKKDAEDIFQDTILAFYNKAKTEEFTLRSSIRTYIYSISRNMWLAKLRQQKNILSINDIESKNNDIFLIDQSADSALINKENINNISNALNLLSPNCKKVLKLYYYDRLKLTEIAEMMNLQKQTLKNRKSGCMKKLREIIHNDPDLLKYFQE